MRLITKGLSNYAIQCMLFGVEYPGRGFLRYYPAFVACFYVQYHAFDILPFRRVY